MKLYGGAFIAHFFLREGFSSAGKHYFVLWKSSYFGNLGCFLKPNFQSPPPCLSFFLPLPLFSTFTSMLRKLPPICFTATLLCATSADCLPSAFLAIVLAFTKRKNWFASSRKHPLLAGFHLQPLSKISIRMTLLIKAISTISSFALLTYATTVLNLLGKLSTTFPLYGRSLIATSNP